MIKFFFTLLGVLATLIASDNTLDFGGSYRARLESYDNVHNKAYGTQARETLFLQQIIAGATYKPDGAWEYALYFYDARSWGSSLEDARFIVGKAPNDYMMHYYDDHHELHQGYIRKHGFLDSHLTATLGRIQLGYGDRRIFGPGMWGNTIGWLWDGAHLSYKDGSDFFDVWYGQTRIKAPDDFSLLVKHRYEGVGGYGRVVLSHASIEPFFAWRRPLYDVGLAREDRYYAGGRIYEKSAGFIYDATVVKNFGTQGSKVFDAYAHAARFGLMWERPSIEATIGHTYASGDTNPNDATIQTFDTPFGLVDGMHYGRMDIVTWKNLNAVDFKLSSTPLKSLQLTYNIHWLYLASPYDKWYNFGYQNLNGATHTAIGTEHDVIIQYQANKALTWLAIFGYLDAGAFIVQNNISQNDAAKLFVQLLFTF